MGAHPDPFRDVDAQPDPRRVIEALETRARMPSQVRLRRRFLRFVPVRAGDRVLEVGCGTGSVLRDVASLVGTRGEVAGVDPSRRILHAARALSRTEVARQRVSFRLASAERLPFRRDRFDVTLAVSVLLHVPDALAAVREMARVTRPGGRVGLQDQDFGTVAVAHPDRELTTRIMEGVAARMYADPWSGRRLPELLRQAGLGDVRLLTDVYQDTTLEAYSKSFLERRAENGVRFGVVDTPTAQRWLDGFNDLVARGAFVLTLNFYGAVGVRPAPARPR